MRHCHCRRDYRIAWRTASRTRLAGRLERLVQDAAGGLACPPPPNCSASCCNPPPQRLRKLTLKPPLGCSTRITATSRPAARRASC